MTTAAVQKYGTFDSGTGKYCFDGKWYQPRWMANGIKNRDWVSIRNTCIEGYDSKVGNSLGSWPKTILVLCNLGGTLNLWDQIAKSYPGLYAQSQLHYYDASIPAGQVPDWALAWIQSGYLLMHEYERGKVAWLRKGTFENDIYIFMTDTDAPSEETSNDTSDDTSDDTSSASGSDTSTTSLSGLFPMNSTTTITGSILSKGDDPVVITVKPLE